ncbi:MAG: pyrimidine 5'-nucleotidase [Micropepsaceae bacterium]
MKNSPHPSPDFSHIEDWIFDLDNTLYPPSCNLFSQIDTKMRSFICDLLGVDEAEAYRLQKQYFREHGTTLSGLMKVHDIKPERFLEHVHDLDVSIIPKDPLLGQALMALPGRRLVYTNGTVAHAERVLAQIGIDHLVDDIFDIVLADYHPKPRAESFDRFVKRHSIDPVRSAMFEDLDRNLAPAHELGMTTVLVRALDGHADPAVRGWGEPAEGAAHIHFRTEDLADFLFSIRLRSKP